MESFHKFLILGFIALILSCSEDSSGGAEGAVYDVDPVFEPYVREFIAEGGKRGHNIDFNDTGLKVEFSDFPLNGAAGLCTLRRHHVVIDKANWFRFSERFRAYLLFHELGHCELDRLHKNDQFSDQTWKSIMRGDPFNGIQNRLPVPYYGFRKDHYLDELFDTNTPAPSWGERKFAFQLSNPSVVTDTLFDINRFNQNYSNVTGNYEFDIRFDLIDDNSITTRLEWGALGENYYLEIFPGWGYTIGVNLEGLSNNLYYNNNINFVNDRKIDRITVRNHDGFDQIFINEEFIFHIDPSKLDYVKMTAMDGSQINNDFSIESYSLELFE